VATGAGRSVDDVLAALGRIRDRLFAARAGRPRPHLDDKILTAWNGLMIAAFARAARVLVSRPSSREYLDAATRAASFIKRTLWSEAGLLRRYRDGEAAIDAYAEDYAYLIWGLLELFQASGEAEWLDWALALQARQDEKFWDEKEGGWFSTTGEDPTVLLRLKEDYDGAEPAASSVAALNTLTIAHLSGDDVMRQKAERTLGRYGPRIGAAGRTIPMMLCALSAWHAGLSQIVIAGDAEVAHALNVEVARHYLPFGIVIPIAGGADDTLSRLLPFTASMTRRGGAAAYVCRNFTCRQPVSTPTDLEQELESLITHH
ncbi:MAG: thioredoxin domain-containing protein, partial [Acidobacteriota bacterium]|nr:thioredoxin domain-containing protein [Acidobacteriota bacterium]